MNLAILTFGIGKMTKTSQTLQYTLCIKDSTEKDVLVNQSMMTLSDGDVLNIMMCVETGEEGLGIETLFPNSRPVIPSIIVSLLKISEINSGGHWVTTGKGTGRIWME